MPVTHPARTRADRTPPGRTRADRTRRDGTSAARARTAGLAALAALVLPVFAAAPAHAAARQDGPGTTYRVDCSSTKAPGTGEPNRPWTSLAEVGAHTFGPGDRILFRAGVTCTGKLDLRGDGTASAPVSTGAYGEPERLKPVIDGAGAAYAVRLANASHWRITGLDVTNPAPALAARTGILVEVTDDAVHGDVVVSGNEVHHVAGETNKATHATDFVLSAGIRVGSTSVNGRTDGVRITGNTVHDTGGGGIKARPGFDLDHRGAGLYVARNRIDRVGGDGVVLSQADEPLAELNTAYDLGKGAYPYTGGNFAGIWAISSRNPVIQFNEVARSVKSVFDSNAWDCDWGNTGTCLVQYNYSHDNAGGMFLQCNNCGTNRHARVVVRYNIAQNDGRIVNAANDASPMEFYGNTLYNPSQKLDVTFPAGAKVSDNIWVAAPGSALPANAVYEANAYQGFDAPAGDAKAVTGDPGLLKPGTAGDGMATVGGYRLAAGSPALGAGVDVAGDGGRDYWGNALTSPANLGAYAGPGIG